MFKPLLDLIYPVGSFYHTFKNDDPADLFGGSWSQVSDKFLFGNKTYYTNEYTGGTQTVTLDDTKIPKHTHSYDKITSITGTAISAAQLPAHGFYGYGRGLGILSFYGTGGATGADSNMATTDSIWGLKTDTSNTTWQKQHKKWTWSIGSSQAHTHNFVTTATTSAEQVSGGGHTRICHLFTPSIFGKELLKIFGGGLNV